MCRFTLSFGGRATFALALGRLAFRALGHALASAFSFFVHRTSFSRVLRRELPQEVMADSDSRHAARLLNGSIMESSAANSPQLLQLSDRHEAQSADKKKQHTHLCCRFEGLCEK